MIEHLKQLDVGNSALHVGDHMPDFGLTTVGGKLLTSAELLSTGPLVLSFYGGAWCSCCRADMMALRDSHDAIVASGGRVAIVCGEIDDSNETKSFGNSLPFDILNDIDLGLALTFGLLFALPKKTFETNNPVKYDLSGITSNPSWFIPLPATYVVGCDGNITNAFIEPDFRHPMKPVEILGALARIKTAAA